MACNGYLNHGNSSIHVDHRRSLSSSQTASLSVSRGCDGGLKVDMKTSSGSMNRLKYEDDLASTRTADIDMTLSQRYMGKKWRREDIYHLMT